MKQNKILNFQSDTKTTLLLVVLNALFIAYFLFMAIYNRLSQDDFLFLKSVHNSGCIQLVKWAYLFQSGRFTHYSYISIIFLIIDKTGSFFIIPVIVWVIDFFLLLFVMKKILNKNNYITANLSALILNVFILTNFEFTAFYWICSTFYYIQPVLVLFLFVMVNQKNVSKIQYCLLIFIAVLISGSSEIFVPFCLLFTILNLGYYYIKNNKDLHKTISDKRIQRLLLSLIILFIGFVIVIIAPGNYLRAKEVIFHHPDNVVEFLKISIQSFVLFLYLLAFKFPYYIILILISFLIGFFNRTNFVKDFNYKRFLIISWASYLLFIFLSILPTAYLMSGFGFQRIYTSTIFFSMLFFIIQGFVFGLKTNFQINILIIKRLILINIFILIPVMVINLIVDIPTAKKYSQSDIERTNLILDLKKHHHKRLVELKPLYKPTTYSLKYLILREKQPLLYYCNEIESDTSAYSNMCIKNYYELDFSIRLK